MTREPMPKMTRLARIPHSRKTTQRREELERLGCVLRQFRESRGLTQEAVSNATGIARTSLSAVERGDQNLSFRKLRRWLLGLRVTWREFFTALHEIDSLASTSISAVRLQHPAPSGGDGGLGFPEIVALGRVVRGYRLATGKSQKVFAECAGFDRALVGIVERAQRNPGFTLVRRFVIALGVRWDQFGVALDSVDDLSVASACGVRAAAVASGLVT